MERKRLLTQRARLLFAQTSRIGAFDVSSSDDGTTPVTGALERTGIWLDDPDVNKLLRGIRPRIDTTAGTAVSIQLGASMTPGGAVDWGAPIAFTPGVDIKADGFAQGVFGNQAFVFGSVAYALCGAGCGQDGWLLMQYQPMVGADEEFYRLARVLAQPLPFCSDCHALQGARKAAGRNDRQSRRHALESRFWRWVLRLHVR